MYSWLHLSLIGSVLLLSGSALAGAWVLPRGDIQAFNESSYYTTAHFTDNAGNSRAQTRYTKWENSLLAEYGANDDITLGVNIRAGIIRRPSQPLSATTTLSSGWEAGITRLAGHVRHALWSDEQAVLSAQIGASIPSQLNQNTLLLNQDYNEESLEFRLLYGRNITREAAFSAHQPDFFNIELGYDWRTGNATELLHLDATYGYRVLPQLMLMPQLFATFGEGTDSPQNTGSPRYNYDLIKAQLSAIIPVSADTQMQFGAFHHLYNRNTGGGGGALLSWWIAL